MGQVPLTSTSRKQFLYLILFVSDNLVDHSIVTTPPPRHSTFFSPRTISASPSVMKPTHSIPPPPSPSLMTPNDDHLLIPAPPLGMSDLSSRLSSLSKAFKLFCIFTYIVQHSSTEFLWVLQSVLFRGLHGCGTSSLGLTSLVLSYQTTSYSLRLPDLLPWLPPKPLMRMPPSNKPWSGSRQELHAVQKKRWSLVFRLLATQATLTFQPISRA